MNHPIAPLSVVLRQRFLLAVFVGLLLAAIGAPAAGAATPEHHFLPKLTHDFVFPTSPGGTATDDEGDLYVPNSVSPKKVSIFDPQGHLITEFDTLDTAGYPQSVAVDPAGDIYVDGIGDVVKYVPSSYPPVAGTTYTADPLIAAGARDIALDPVTEDLYVAEEERISIYAADGTPISPEIGAGLVPEEAYFETIDVLGSTGEIFVGTAPTRGENEIQELVIENATGGTYALSFEGQSTGWQGTGELHGTTAITGFTTTDGALVAGEEISGSGIAPGTLVEEIDNEDDSVVLSQSATGSGPTSLTAVLPYDAEDRTVRLALERLSTVGSGGVRVFETEAESPFELEVEFRGKLGERNVPQIGADASHLSGAGAAITVSTTFEGVPGEPPMVYVLDPSATAIEAAIDGSTSPAGTFAESFAPSIAVDQTSGNVLVTDLEEHGVIDEFDPEGHFVSQIGPAFGEGLSFPGSGYLGVDNGASSPGAGDVFATVGASIYAFGPAVSGPVLTVEKGSNPGRVESDPAGIDCGAACGLQSAQFELGETVVLTAIDGPGSRFIGWETGDCDEVLGPGETECKVQMNAARTVEAQFVSKYLLTVLPTGLGSGTVTSSPTGIDCGAECEAEYDAGEEVTLTAVAAAGSRFAGWTPGGCQEVLGPEGETCKVTMTATAFVEPEFIEAYALAVTKAGSGSGTVTGSPTGIDCGARCGAEFGEGTRVTLTATAASGSHFVGWSGGGCSGTATCLVDAAAQVTATFDVDSSPPSGASHPQSPSSPAPMTSPGRPRVGSTVAVKGGKALLKVRCGGSGACSGTLELTTKAKGKTVVLGKASFKVGVGRSRTVKVKLSSAAKKLLAAGPLKVKVHGDGVDATVTLKSSAKR